MKHKVYLFTVLASSLMLFSCGTGSGPKKNAFDITNGMNVSLSQRLTRSDFVYIASLGFDHVRIPFNEVQMFDENGQKIPEAFALLHKLLGWCDELDLRAVLDLHVLRSHHYAAAERPLFTDVKAQEQFYECWRKISGEMSKYSVDKVAYEPMNEPVANDPEDWNKVLNRCVEAIRELEPERTILLGSNEWSHWDTMKDLKVPENNPNLIINFHYYKPPLLTHYNSWLYRGDEIPVPVHYPGQTIWDNDLDSAKHHKVQGRLVYNIDIIESNFLEVVEFAKKYNLKVVCSEYGCYDAAPADDRLRWMQDVNTLFLRHRIARTFWSYGGRGGFSMFLRNGQPDTEFLNAILMK